MLNKFPNALKVHTYDQVIHLVELYKIGGKNATEAATIFGRFQISYELQLKQALYVWILNFKIFPGIQEHQNWSLKKEVMQVPSL